MKKLPEFFKRKYMWALMMAVIMTLSSAYTLLDALVIPKSYTVVTKASSGNSNNDNTSAAITAGSTEETESTAAAQTSKSSGTAPANAVATDYSYKDDNISVNIEKAEKKGAVFYVADVKLSDASYLKTAFANDTFGKNITEATSAIAANHNAIFAINGDYYGFRDTGLIIRNGVLYRDIARNSPDNRALTINGKGELEIVTEGEAAGESLVENGILQSFSFGPVLVENGQAADISTRVSQSANPRTAIGQISPLHYIFIVVDGRSNESNGMTLEQLAQEFVERGAAVAYNLDGGGSSTMYLNGNVINNPTDGRHDGERSISDILYLGY